MKNQELYQKQNPTQPEETNPDEIDFDYYKKWEYPVEKVAIIAEPTDDELERIEDDLLDILN